MIRSRGQSLVELALCAPIVMLLALGAAAAVRTADAHAGLEAATQAAAGAAARSSDAASAKREAEQRFASMIAGYPVREPVLRVTFGTLSRTDDVIATSSGFVEIGWAAMLLLPSRVALRSSAVVHIEPWRTHGPVS